MAQLLPHDRLVQFYEREPYFIEHHSHGRHVIAGDFRDTLVGQWAVIINDTPVRNFDFSPYLLPDGLVIE